MAKKNRLTKRELIQKHGERLYILECDRNRLTEERTKDMAREAKDRVDLFAVMHGLEQQVSILEKNLRIMTSKVQDLERTLNPVAARNIKLHEEAAKMRASVVLDRWRHHLAHRKPNHTESLDTVIPDPSDYRRLEDLMHHEFLKGY